MLTFQFSKVRDFRKRDRDQQRINTQTEPDKHPQMTKARRILLLTISDAQILIALAFGLNFAAESKCSLTTYHFGVALDTVLICCSTMAFSLSICRDFWRTPASALVRFILSTFIFVCLGVFIFYENQGRHFPNWPPSSDNPNDFLVLLPAACLEDPDLFSELDSSSTIQSADSLRLAKLGSQSFVILFIPLAVVYLIAVVISLSRIAEGSINVGRRSKCYIGCIFWFLLRLVPVVVGCYCWASIPEARRYVNDSGWMVLDNGNNPELDINSIGQILAMLTALWFIVLLLDTIERHKKGGHLRGHEKV